jgi:eukaryotic-like serine/threonine-protein kinase
MSTSTTMPASSAHHPAPVKEGDILASKYRVEKVLGIGGMGVVVAAEHIELSQKVALKFLLKEAAKNDDLVMRFLREARASVRLKGSHVAKTLDVGRLENGAPYIVMEFLEGHDLHTELRSKEQRVAVEDAVSYVVQAAEGLAEAHALGIVHRDLKPGNLFLTRGVDGRPLVKVLDFGISKTMDTSLGGDGLSLTKTEMLLGSPLYMSPEQMRSSKNVDERSDLWALGVIAFELLTGRLPFEADSILELCFKVAQESAPSAKELRPDLPDELCAAVAKCLEKDPADRFANVGELARAFEPFALARDRGTAERALDVLGTGKRPPQRSSPSLSVEAAAPQTPAISVSPLASLSASEQVAVAAAVTAVAEIAPSSPDPVAPAAWGTTQAQTSTKSRKGIAAIAGAVIVVAALAGTLVALRKAPADGGGPVAAVGALSAHVAAPSAASTETPAAMQATAASATGAAPVVAATGAVDADAGAAAVASSAPAKPVGRPVAAAASPAAATAKPVKPVSSAAVKTAPTADPGGFIKVRE